MSWFKPFLNPLFQEFSAQSRAGRSQTGFVPKPFQFRPVPAVPDF